MKTFDTEAFKKLVEQANDDEYVVLNLEALEARGAHEALPGSFKQAMFKEANDAVEPLEVRMTVYEAKSLSSSLELYNKNKLFGPSTVVQGVVDALGGAMR